MAISQMYKISLILAKEQVDELLATLQEYRWVEIREITKEKQWKEAFDASRATLPDIKEFDSVTGQWLSGQEALHFLSQNRHKLEQAISQLNKYIPKMGVLENLRSKPRQFSFKQIENLGHLHQQGDSLVKEVDDLLAQLEKLDHHIDDLQKEYSYLEDWKSLPVTPKQLKDFSYINAVIGTIPSSKEDDFMRQMATDDSIDYQEIFSTETQYGVLIFLHDIAEKQDKLETYAFKPFDYNREELPVERLDEIRVGLDEATEKRQKLLQKLQNAKPLLEDLEVQLEYSLNLYAREYSKQQLASTNYLIALEGWIESEHFKDLERLVHERFEDSIYIHHEEVTEKDWDDVPIKLRNNRLVEPFENITQMYALPKYYEKDPTPILAPFYFTFFGMMVADLGYGLLMFSLTALAMKYFHFSKSMAKNLRFFNMLGISVSLWGVIYGSFFGYSMPVQLLNTTTNVMTILLLSVAFGFITVITGLLLGGLRQVKLKDYAESYQSGFAWCLIFIGVVLMVIGKFIPTLSVLSFVGQWLAIINAIGIVVVAIVSRKSLSGLGAGLFNLYNISSYVGDLVSFTRLMALGLSGASIGSAFNLIVGLFPPVARFTVGIVLFIILHSINMALSLLSGYVHSARLIFVEFFGKFYEGGGRAFSPLKPAEKYVDIVSKKRLEDK